MACILRVSGKRFAVEHVHTSLKVDAMWRKGDQRLAGLPSGPRHNSSGLNVLVSSRALSDFPGQRRDALKFLVKHRRALTRLISCAGVDDATLDFGIERRDVFSIRPAARRPGASGRGNRLGNRIVALSSSE
jgi:hypothetical protein